MTPGTAGAFGVNRVAKGSDGRLVSEIASPTIHSCTNSALVAQNAHTTTANFVNCRDDAYAALDAFLFRAAGRGAISFVCFVVVFFRRRFSSGAAATELSLSDDLRVDGLLIGTAPPLLIYAMPSLCKGSAESNFAGKKTIGKPEPGIGRWKAYCQQSRKQTHNSFRMQALNHVNERIHLVVVAEHHAHCHRKQAFPGQGGNRNHRGRVRLGDNWDWRVCQLVMPGVGLPRRQQEQVSLTTSGQSLARPLSEC